MRKFILQFTIMMLSYSYSYAQLPSANPLYAPVFIENFSGPLDSTHWLSHYPWSASNFLDQDTLTTWCGNLVDLASNDKYAADTTNRRISSGTCKLFGKKDLNHSTIWKFHPYPSTACSNLGLTPPSWDTSHSFCLEEKTTTFKYSNGMLFSKDKFKYGYFDISFRIPNWSASSYYSMSPTFWLFSGNSQTLWSELDIFEIRGTDGWFTNNIHVDAVNDTIKAPSNDAILQGQEPFIDLSQWHTASVNWTPTYIDFYLDGNFMRRSTNDTNQYLIAMPLIIDNAITPFNFCVNNIDSINSPLPITYEIDYVKVYQVKLACDTNKVYLTTNQSLFNSKIYKSLTLGGTSGTAVFNNSTASALGTDYVLLTEGFEVGNNMDMLIDIQSCWSSQQYLPNSVIINSPPSNLQKAYKASHNYSN